ncbi:Fructose-bisphosphate aldolase class II [hydrothermal vent metagenome]|uniref:Fructose-bisphosphate aldolase class II n=1 Tax=hydrothermal vent metagenome TaxID=652676 RepID=A0A3B0XUF8_9ZZZZ
MSIGTIHGRMKGKPKLDYPRLKQINDALGIPLVIHGGTGLSDDQFHRLISNGVAKINCFTALSDVVAKKIRENIKSETASSYMSLSKNINLAVAAEVEQCMRLWGAAGRAAEVLARCCSWISVEQIILCTIEGQNNEDASFLINEGQRLLSSIPGVRDVFSGEAVQDNAKYHYTWRIRLCHPAMIDHYRNHSAYSTFINKFFRPVTGKCINIDFQEVVPASSQNQLEQANIKSMVL